MLTDIINSIASYLKALGYVFRPSIFIYILIAGIISLVIGTAVFGAIWHYSEPFGDWLSSFYTWDFGKSLVEFLSEWLIKITLFFIAFICYRYIVLIVTAPILSIISEKLESMLTGEEIPKLTILGNLELMVRGIRIAIRNLFKELIFTLGLTFLGFFTGVGLLLTVLIFIIQAYYAGFGNYDFFLERRFKLNESVEFMSSNKGLAIGNGTIFILLLAIPVLGFIIGPTLSTMAATISGVKKLC